jgi:hypothetical protein
VTFLGPLHRWVGGWAIWAASVGLALAQVNERRFDLQISQGKLPAPQRLIRVTQGESARLNVLSDAPGELHLHAYRLQTQVHAGQVVEWRFLAHASGRYRLEWHPGEVQQPVHGGHHGPALAVIEVYPK